MFHMFIRRTQLRVLLVLATVAFGACSGPRSPDLGAGVPDPVTRRADMSEVETFDAEAYRDVPPATEISVNHDVPDALLQSRADAGIVQVLDGYRVQVFSSLDGNEAVQAEEDVKTWWNGLTPDQLAEYGLSASPAVYNNYKLPLYRVRAGDFTRRSDAERLMVLMASRFATVFVVPDKVTIRR